MRQAYLSGRGRRRRKPDFAFAAGSWHRPAWGRVLFLCLLIGLLVPVSEMKAQRNKDSRRDRLSSSLEAQFRKGVQALRSDRLDDAQRIFEEIIHNGGDVAIVHNNLGIVYQMQHEHPKAITEFHRAIRLAPDYEAPYVLMGASLLSLGNISEAIHELDRATSIAPKEPMARLELGKAYMDADQPLKAVEQFQILRAVSPGVPDYAYELGMAYLKLAEWCTRNIQRINPKSVRMLQIMAEGYRAQGHLDRARALLESAVRIDPKLPGIHLEIAEIALAQGKTQDALSEARKELAIVPESAAALALMNRLGQGGK
jgi:protein O-GlcNAc transferase